MRGFSNWRFAVLLLPLLMGSSGCLLVPKIEDRVVELAVGATTTQEFTSLGDRDNFSESATVDLNSGIDLARILSDNGIDPSEVTSVSLSSVAYMTTKTDPAATRRISAGNVRLRRGAGAETPLVTNFYADVNSVTTWRTLSLDAPGVTLVNQILADLLTIAKGGTPGGSTSVTYTVSGATTPAGVDTNFKWALKLTLSIVGKVKVKVVN
jgi:hypothetical protein